MALYAETTIGDPLDDEHLMGPLVDAGAVATMLKAIETAKGQGATVPLRRRALDLPGGCYVTPCLVEAPSDLPIVQEETFAPILYVTSYRTIEEAIALQNGVPQGLSSAIITNDFLESELFLSGRGERLRHRERQHRDERRRDRRRLRRREGDRRRARERLRRLEGLHAPPDERPQLQRPDRAGPGHHAGALRRLDPLPRRD